MFCFVFEIKHALPLSHNYSIYYNITHILMEIATASFYAIVGN